MRTVSLILLADRKKHDFCFCGILRDPNPTVDLVANPQQQAFSFSIHVFAFFQSLNALYAKSSDFSESLLQHIVNVHIYCMVLTS